MEGFLTGAMDEIRFYNRVLSAAEVKGLYEEGGLPDEDPALQGCQEIPKLWSISYGCGGGFNPTYNFQDINSEGLFNYLSKPFVLSTRERPEKLSAKLSSSDLGKLKNLFAKAYPFSKKGETRAKSFYVWYNIAPDKGEARHFDNLDQAQVRELVEFLDGIKEKYSAKK